MLTAASDDGFPREQGEQEDNGPLTRALLDGLGDAADARGFGDEDGWSASTSS